MLRSIAGRPVGHSTKALPFDDGHLAMSAFTIKNGRLYNAIYTKG